MTEEGLMVALPMIVLITVVYLLIDRGVSRKIGRSVERNRWIDSIYQRIENSSSIDDLIDLRREVMRDGKKKSGYGDNIFIIPNLINKIERKLDEMVGR